MLNSPLISPISPTADDEDQSNLLASA